MKFRIDNGTGICTIGMSDIGSYIRFNYPLTVVWDDCHGSIGRYFCVLPYNKAYRSAVRESIHENLDQDFTDRIPELYEMLEPLFPLFKNGNYFLKFHNNRNREFFEYWCSTNHFEKPRYEDLEVVFPHTVTDIRNTDKVIKDHKRWLKEAGKSKEVYPAGLLEWSTGGIYGRSAALYATQPMQAVDKDRVAFFENAIRNGARPFAVIFNASYDKKDFDSPNFILDGHHKLLAYYALKIYPPLAVITCCPENDDELEFDAGLLAESLYPWQVEHLMEHWDDKHFSDESAAQDGLERGRMMRKGNPENKNNGFPDWLKRLFD